MRKTAMNLSTAASLFLIVLFCEEIQSQSNWNVNCNGRNICALKGSTVKMHCEYSHPYWERGTTISVRQTFWFTKTDKDPVDLKTQEEYAGRVEYSCNLKNCTLTIRDVKESDSAVYKFRFTTNIEGGGYTGEPGVQLSVTDLTVKKKNSYRNSPLVCSSSCVLPDDSTYVWYKNGKDMNTRTPVYNKWVNNEDSISCALEGLEDFPSPLACFKSSSCNKVIYSDRRICALKGSSVSFYSNYIPYYSSYSTTSFWFSPGRSTEWKNPSQPENLKLDSKYAGRVQVTNTRQMSTLTINNLMENDSAEYRFTFETDRFTWGSDLHGTTLTVTDLQVEVTGISANQDPQFAELKCHSRCSPAGYYRWFRNGQGIRHYKSTYKVLINMTDKISCALSSLKEPRAPEVYAPGLTSLSANSTDVIVEGNQVFLKCSSDANPPANYTWYKKTKSSVLQLPRKDSKFYLRAIQSSDSGEYFCVAKNQLGENISVYLNIDVKYAPKRADVFLRHAEIMEGDSVNLTCSSDGNPAPSYIWYKDNQVMLQGQGGVYQFPSVKSEDSGTYCCEVGNIYGRINSSTVLINVEYPPRLPSVSMNPPGDVAAGSSVNLTCNSVANPAATYIWYKEHSASPAAEGQTFAIVDIRGEHGGNYYCQARNSRGHHNSTIYLIVVSSSASSAVAGSITFLLLIGLFLSAFIIFRKKKAARQIHQTREGAGDNETKRLGNLGRHLESSSTAGRGNSVAQDDVCYASVLFSKNQEEPLYSNFMPAEPKTSQNKEKEENVEYSAIMIKKTPCKKSCDASDESSALYSTVCKANRL